MSMFFRGDPDYIHLRRRSTYNQRKYELANKIFDMLEDEIVKTGEKYAVLKMSIRKDNADKMTRFLSHHWRERAFIDRLSGFSLKLEKYYKGNIVIFDDQVWFILCEGGAWKEHALLFWEIVKNMMPMYNSILRY